MAWGELVSGNYFEVMGVRTVGPHVHSAGGGRALGALPVAVISARFVEHFFSPIPTSWEDDR